MSISRRNAPLGATAAAVVTGVTVAPLAIKAASVQATLVQQGDDSEPRDSTKLIEALARDFERLAGEARS